MAKNDYFAAIEQMANRLSSGQSAQTNTQTRKATQTAAPAQTSPATNRNAAVESFANAIQSAGSRPATYGPATIEGPAKIQTPELDKAVGNTNATGPLAESANPENWSGDAALYLQTGGDVDRATIRGLENIQRKALGDAAGGVRSFINEAGYLAQASKNDIRNTEDWTGDAAAYLQTGGEVKLPEEQKELKRITNLGQNFQNETQNLYGDIKGGWKVAGDLAGTIGQMAPAMAANVIPLAGPALSTAYLFGSAAGNATEQAAANGASLNKAVDYGIASGAVEAATEKLFDGLGGLLGKGAADDIVESVIGKLTAKSGSNALRNALRLGFGALGEGAEEGISALADPILQSIYNNQTVRENYKDLDWSDVGYQIFLGVLSGGVLGSLGLVNGQYKGKNAELNQQVVNEVVNDVLTNSPEGQAVAQRAQETASAENPLTQTILANEQGQQEQASKDIDAEAKRIFETPYTDEFTGETIQRHWDSALGSEKFSAYLQATGVDLDALIESQSGMQLWSFFNDLVSHGGDLSPSAAAQAFSEFYNAGTQRMNGTMRDVMKRAYEIDGHEMPDGIRRQYFPTAEEQAEAQKRDKEYQKGIDAYKQALAKRAEGQAPAAPTPPIAQTVLNNERGTEQAGQGTQVRVQPAPANADGSKLSASVPTVQNAPSTSPEFSALIDKTVSENGYRYIPITNNETVQNATQRIQKEGWERARANWTADVRSGKTSAEMMATGALLYNNAVNAGDLKAAADIMADYVAVGTNTAQALQARKIIQSMQPEMRLYMIERSVERMVKDLNLPEGVKISDSLKEEYLKATTDEQRNEIVTRMQKEVADQIPATFKDKWTALRYVNMLGNFRTQFRNIIGNTTMELLTRAKNGIQVLYESAAEKLTGGKYERTTSVKPDSDLVQAAKAYYNANADVINGEGKYSDNQTATGFMKGVEEQKTIFGKGTRSEWASDLASRIAGRDVEVKKNVLENYRNATNWAMTKGDTVFIGNRFSRSLAGYLQANGMDAATFSGIQDGSIQATAEQQALIDRAINYATKEAQEATFHDNNALSNWISKIGRKPGTPKAVKAISEGIMPFRKTPANVLLRAEEYSPLGFVNAIYKSIQNRKGAENVTATDVVNSLAKATTGTIMFALGMALRNAGWLRGREDDEKQENFDKLQGKQDYSLNFPGGGSITLDWLSPTSIPLFLGVQFEDAREDGGVSIENALEILSQITNPMIQMSMLQGVNDTLDNIKYSDNNLVQIALTSMVSYLTQGLTNTLVGQMERTSEDRRTSTYLDAETALGRRVQNTLGKVSQKTPGWDYNQVEYLDAWGRPDMAEETGFARAFNNMLNPGYVSQANSTEVDDELQRLYDAGAGNVFPQRISMTDKINVYDEHGQVTGQRQLTADEYVQVQREAGQTKLQMVKDLMASPVYDGMSDEARADAISEIYKYANYEAIRKVEPSHEDKYSGISGLSNIPAYFAAQKTYSNAADNRWARDYGEIRDLMENYSTLAPDVRKYLEEKNSQLRKVHEAYAQRVTPETWFQTYDKIQDLEPYGDNKGVSAWQKYEAVVQNNPRQADAILQSYMDESAYTRYTTARDFGVSPELYIAYYKQNALTDAKDENGKSVNGLKKERMEQWFLSQGYSKAQFNYMYKLFNANTADLANFNAGYR